MAAQRSLLSCLVLSAVVLTGLSAPAQAQTPTAAQAAAQPATVLPATLAPAVTAPMNLTVAQSLPLDDDLPPAAGPDGILSGSRKAAGMVDRDLSDTVKQAWNPTTGNILFTGKLLHLEGIGRDIDVSWRYNSINDDRPTFSEGTKETALIVGADNSATYTAADGGTYKFVPKTGGGWTMPPGLNATLTALSSAAATLRFNDTGHANFYENVGGVYRLAFTGDQFNATADRIAYAYDTDGRLDTITTATGRKVLFEYNDDNNTGQPSKITDQTLNRSISVTYDSDGRFETMTDATGATTHFDYSSDLLSSFTDALGTVTELSYDGAGKAAQITYAAGTGAATVHTLDAVDATTSALTETGRVTTFKFNTARQITSVTDPLGNVSTKTFNTHDDQLTNLDALGNTTTSVYNPNNTLKNITAQASDPGTTGGQVAYTYPAATAGEAFLEFQPLSSKNTEDQTTTYTYDTVTRRPYQTLTPGGAGGTRVNRYQGDAAATTCGGLRGQLCKTIDGKGNTTSITYDAARNPVTITPPAPLGVITNTFDAAGRIATTKDGKNQTATYVYDENDRLLQTRFGATCVPATCVTYTYDGNGNLKTRVDGSGTTTHNYDQQNRPISKTIGGVTTSLTYDAASNVTSFTDPTGTVNYRYDASDRLTALAEPGGSCPATPVFPNSTKCTGFDYDKNDRRIGTKYPNGVKNATVYDKAGRITTITATNTAAAVLAKREYTYTQYGIDLRDGALRKSMRTETGAFTAYSYDAMQRLSQAINTTTGITESWTYDANGNRVTSAKTGTTTVNWAYNAADQLCWTSTGTGTSCATPPAGAATYAFDANGNQIRAGTVTSTWNTFNQLASHTNSSTTSFTYADQGNTERLTSGGTSFLNGSLGITQQTTAGASTSFIRDPEGTLISMRNSAGASFYYTTDALGSTILLTDSAQAKAATYLYDSWGNTTTQTGTQAAVNPWRYAGGYKDDATGYTKFGARYYAPGHGRFTQADPSGQEANRYAYAGCNPINTTDPSGLGPLCDAFNDISNVMLIANIGANTLWVVLKDPRWQLATWLTGGVGFIYGWHAQFFYCPLGL